MGAYANPQEIEGQFDFTQNQKSLQRMFDTVTASASVNSSRLTEMYQMRAKKNEQQLAQQKEENNKVEVLKIKGDMKNSSGLNVDFWQEGVNRFIQLNSQSVRTPEDNRERSEILAGVDDFASGFSVINKISEDIAKASAYEPGGIGAIDLYGTAPKILYAIQGLTNKDANKVELGVAQNASGRKSWITPTLNIKGYDNTVKEAYKQTYGSIADDPDDIGDSLDLKKLDENFTKGLPYGVVFIPDVSQNIKKIQDQNAVQPGGGGIFVMNEKGVYSGKVADEYLIKTEESSIPLSADKNGGVTRVDAYKVNKAAIASNTNLLNTTKSVVGGFMQNPNNVASGYNHFTLKSIEAQAAKGYKTKDEKRSLEDYERYRAMGDGTNGTGFFKYNDAGINNRIGDIQHNQIADVVNSIDDYQPKGKPYYVGPTAIKLEDTEVISKTGETAKVWEVLNQKALAANGNKPLGEGNSKEIDFSIKKDNDALYKVRVTELKGGGYKFRVIGRYEESDNK